MPKSAKDKKKESTEIPVGKSLCKNVGTSHVSTHFGELLQGQFIFGGCVHRGLITLPCPVYYSNAKFEPIFGASISVKPPKREKALKAVLLALKHIGRPDWGGSLQLESNIPQSIGGGSSSGDVVAAIRAVAAAFKTHISDEEIALLAVAAETASDSTMFEDGNAVLFAQREGVLLETFGVLPELEAVGITDGNKVDTLSYPPAVYNDDEIRMFMGLLEEFRKAIVNNDAEGIANVATQSSIINQKFLPKPNFDELLGLAEVVGAVGVSVSHSGSALTFLFDGAEDKTPDKIADLTDRLLFMNKTDVLKFRPSGFERDDDEKEILYAVSK